MFVIRKYIKINILVCRSGDLCRVAEKGYSASDEPGRCRFAVWLRNCGKCEFSRGYIFEKRKRWLIVVVAGFLHEIDTVASHYACGFRAQAAFAQRYGNEAVVFG